MTAPTRDRAEVFGTFTVAISALLALYGMGAIAGTTFAIGLLIFLGGLALALFA